MNKSSISIATMFDSPSYRKIQALRNREERESKKRQRELEKARKEIQKLTAIEQARLEVEAYENDLEVLLSVHKETSPTFDWRAIAYSLPPHPPFNAKVHATAFSIREILRPLLTLGESPVRLGSDIPLCEAERMDLESYLDSTEKHARLHRDWQEAQALAHGVIKGDDNAYIKAISEFSGFKELSSLGSAVHVVMRGREILECDVVVNGQDILPKQVKTLTSAGKVSVKPMPKNRFHEIYQDYVCGCVLRVARELFALLPIQTVIGHATVMSVDRRTGTDRETKILSVIMPRNHVEALNFSRLDPSDTIETFEHRGNVLASRKTGEFQEVVPFKTTDLKRPKEFAESLDSILARVHNTKISLISLQKKKAVRIEPALEIETTSDQ